LFEPNSTEVRPELYPVIGVIAEVINRSRRLILVEGHTDNSPVVGNVFYSNWELSVLRATSMVRLLAEQCGSDPTRISATSYSHYRPIANNESLEGRASTRRVEIIMLNASTYDDLLEDESVPR